MTLDPAEPTRTLADLIEQTRIARRLTPAEAAREIGVSSTLISRWRRGIARRGAGISWDHLVKLADWLRVPVSEIQELAGYPTGSDPSRARNVSLADARKAAVDEAWKIMSEHRRQFIFEIAQAELGRQKAAENDLGRPKMDNNRPPRIRPSLSVASMRAEFGDERILARNR